MSPSSGSDGSRLRGIAQAVAGLMGMFGGFFLNLSPPPHYLASEPLALRKTNHGIASFCVFLTFLLIRALVKQRKTSDTRWIAWGVGLSIVGVFMIILYAWVLGELTVGSGDYVYLAGLWRDGSWVEHNSTLIREIGGNRELFSAMPPSHYERAWPLASRLSAYALVQAMYIMSIVALFGAVFCFWEGVLNTRSTHQCDNGS